jgi:hypothetical protein
VMKVNKNNPSIRITFRMEIQNSISPYTRTLIPLAKARPARPHDIVIAGLRSGCQYCKTTCMAGQVSPLTDEVFNRSDLHPPVSSKQTNEIPPRIVLSIVSASVARAEQRWPYSRPRISPRGPGIVQHSECTLRRRAAGCTSR